MTREQLKAFAEEAELYLAGLGAKHGVKVAHKGGTFGSVSAVVKFELTTIKADGTVADPDAERFRWMAPGKGMAASDLGKAFTSHDGHRYTVVGMTKGGKVIIRRQSNGKDYTMHTFTAANYLKTAAVAS